MITGAGRGSLEHMECTSNSVKTLRADHDEALTMTRDQQVTKRAEALFVSDLAIHCHPSEAEVAAAIKHAIRAHGGIRGCAGEVGAAYGDYPETAPARMRWARQVVEASSG